MADEANPLAEKQSKPQKAFTLKAFLTFAVFLVFYTIVLFYYLKGNSGKATQEETVSNSTNLKMFERLVNEENQIKPIIIKDIVVPIKLDKSGDTSKLLSCGFAFQLGLTLKEQKAIDENKWPPLKESTRFGNEITVEEYLNPEWSLKNIIDGKSKKDDHGGAAKGVNPESYIAYLTNLEVDLRAKILNILMQTTYSQINTEDGQNQICEQLKNEANAMLKSLGKYPRVKKVSFIDFVPPN